MAKTAPNPISSTELPTKKMVLRVRPTQKSKRVASESEDEDREWSRPTSSVKRSKSSNTQKSKNKNKNKNKKKQVDPNKPKKPPTAFFYFLEDFRKGFQEENPEVKSMCPIGKAGGEKWKTMTYEDKVNYYDIATEKRAEFDRAMDEYIRRKECGEDDGEADSDSELYCE